MLALETITITIIITTIITIITIMITTIIIIVAQWNTDRARAGTTIRTRGPMTTTGTVFRTHRAH